MPTSELAKQILEENQGLRADVTTLAEKIGTLEGTGRHTRWLTYVLIAAMTIVIVVWGYNRTNSRIDGQARYDLASCQRGNESRAAQRQQWLDTRNLLVNLGAGKSTLALADNLVTKANHNFPQVDCKLVTRNGSK